MLKYKRQLEIKHYKERGITMRRIISITGKPGAGKGTRLSRFLEKEKGNYTVIAVGNMLRKEVENNTELGIQAKAYMDAGKLVPDYIVVNLVLDKIKENQQKNIILDAFPRTEIQAEDILEFGCNIDRVINIDISDEEVIRRARERIVCEKCGEAYTLGEYKKPKKEEVCDRCGGKVSRRSDDEEDVVKKRLEIYRNETEPVLSFLKRCGVEVRNISGESFELTAEFKRAMTEF